MFMPDLQSLYNKLRMEGRKGGGSEGREGGITKEKSDFTCAGYYRKYF